MEVVKGGGGRKRKNRKIDIEGAREGANRAAVGPDGRAQVQITPDDMEDVQCAHCGGRFFRMTMMLKKIKGVLVGAPKDQLVPIQVMRCDDCGTPLEEMIPNMPQGGEAPGE